MNEVCDFCGSRHPLWEYPCDDFMAALIGVTETDVQVTEEGYEGAWLACDACHGLILVNAWRGLAERSVDAPAVANDWRPGEREACIEAVEDLHKGFRDHRCGEAVRLPA